jgi:hypothetical protein
MGHGCLPESVSATAAIPQIAADLLHRPSRQSRAASGNHRPFRRHVNLM